MRTAALAAGVLAAGIITAPPATASTPGPTELHPCATATERCDGELQLPLNWADPGGERITVAFAFVPRREQSRPATGTIMANMGGPAQMIALVPLIEQILGPVLDRKNLIVVDPRGFGRSTPLTCPDIDVRFPERVSACVDRLGRDRVPFFTADQAVRDFDAVRAALGVPTVTFYGNSYGTVFAQAYASRFPERVRAVFLDSPVLLRDDGYTAMGAAIATQLRTGEVVHPAVCRASRACRTTVRDPAAEFDRLVRLLRAHPDPALPLGDVVFLPRPAIGVITRETTAAVHAYLTGDPAPLRRLNVMWASLDDESGPDPRTVPQLGGILAYTCGDNAFPFDRDAPPERRREQLAEFYDRTDAFAPFTRAEAQEFFAPFGGWLDRCTSWPLPRRSPPTRPGLDFPDVPVVVVGGQFDGATPAWNVGRTAERFPRGLGFVVPFGNHASATGLFGPYSECVRDRLLRPFLTRPRFGTEDPGCTAENYRALGTFPRTMEDLRGGHPVLAATFATVADAVQRRNPNEELAILHPEEAGLRGGRLRFDDTTSTVHLDQVRFVADLAVTGQIRIGRNGTATATVQVAPDGEGVREVTMTWAAFEARDLVRVRGSVDGRPFRRGFLVH